MVNPALEAVLAGSDEDTHLWNLYLSTTGPTNEAQHAFHYAMEAMILIGSDGFEKLFEQDPSMEEYSEALVEVGIPQVKPIFDRVLALIPDELRKPENDKALYSHLRSLFEELRLLASEFNDATADGGWAAARYVRLHRDQFVELGHNPIN